MVPVEEVRAGDTLQRPSGTEHTVRSVEHYPARQTGEYLQPESFIVVYVSHEETSFENKATDKSGFNSRSSRGGVLKQWKPLAPGEFVPLARRAAA
jgi:hypothetical protein